MVGITHGGYKHKQASSFPRTHPHSSIANQRDAPPLSPSAWLWPSCDVPDILNYDPPNTPIYNAREKQINSMDEDLDQDGNGVSPGRLKAIMQHEIENNKNRLREKGRNHHQQQNNTPNYPRVIEFATSNDDVDDDITGFNDPPLEFGRLNLNEESLEETFGFDKDEEFDRLYNGIDYNFEEGQLQQQIRGNDGLMHSSNKGHYRRKSDASNTFDSSIGLNSYNANNNIDTATRNNEARDTATRNNEARANNDHANVSSKSKDQSNQIHHIIEESNKSTVKNERIFRSRQVDVEHVTAKQSHINTQANNAEREDLDLLSPSLVMERRRCAKPTIATPVSSASRPVRPVTPTSMSSPTNSLDESRSRSVHTRNNAQSRNRSVSRSQRSRSHSTRRRSRSRSTSKPPSHRHRSSPKTEEDAYHESLFRGAALIREQLLRSMASADQAMDEAEREFMEEMIERGRRHDGTSISRVNSGLVKQGRSSLEREDVLEAECVDEEDDDNDEIDFDYSQGYHGASNTANKNGQNNGRVVFSKSHSQSTSFSAIETESRRLDNMARIFAATSSASSTVPSISEDESAKRPTLHTITAGSATRLKESSTDQENEIKEDMNMHNVSAVSSNSSDEENAASPTSSLGLNSPNYAKQYFREDTQKSIHTHPSPNIKQDSPLVTTNSINLNNQQREDKENEALSHARSAGPLWRSLVGNHVRFPSQWDNLLPPTSPEIYRPNRKWSKWYYVARHRVKGDKHLNSREFGVRSRRSGGRILLRMVIREMHTQEIRREVAIGCFHPNANGIRKGEPQQAIEDVREVWMAVRWVMRSDGNEPLLDLREERHDYEGVVDKFLTQKGNLDYASMGSALGHRKAVHNENVRAVSRVCLTFCYSF